MSSLAPSSLTFGLTTDPEKAEAAIAQAMQSADTIEVHLEGFPVTDWAVIEQRLSGGWRARATAPGTWTLTAPVQAAHGDPGGSGGGSGGRLRLGSLNFRHINTPTQWVEDAKHAMSTVDVILTSELRKSHASHVLPAFKAGGYAYFQGAGSDTGIAVNTAKYDVVEHHSLRIPGTTWGHKIMGEAVPYVLLRDKATGAEFWVIGAHTQHGGYRGIGHKRMVAQYAKIRGLIGRLEATHPVIGGGDLNNPHALADGVAPAGYQAVKKSTHGIDYLLFNPDFWHVLDHGFVSGTGFDPGHAAHAHGNEFNTDHPFVWGEFGLAA